MPKPSSSGLTGRSADAMAWMGASVALQMVVKLSVTVVLARLLTPEDFGVVAAVMMLIGVANNVIFTGAGLAIIQREVLTPSFRFGIHLICLLLGLGLALLAFFFGEGWAAWMNAPDGALATQLIGIVFLGRAISVVSEHELAREFRYALMSKIDFLSYCVGYGFISVIGAYLNWGFYALIAGGIAHQILRAGALFWFRPMPAPHRMTRSEITEALSATLGFSSANIANALAVEIDNMVVARGLGPAALGLYSRAYDLMKYPTTLYRKVFGRFALTAFSVTAKDPERFARGYLKAVSMIALGGLGMSALLFVFARPIIHLLLGVRWDEMVLPFQIFCTGMYFRLALKLPEAALQAVGRLRLATALNVVYVGLIAAGSSVGVAHGLPGVALGVSLALLVNFLMLSLFARHWVRFSAADFFRAHLPGLNIAVVCLLAGLGCTQALRNQADIVILLVGLSVSALVVLVSIRIAPRLMLGASGVDFLAQFKASAALSRIARWLLKNAVARGASKPLKIEVREPLP